MAAAVERPSTNREIRGTIPRPHGVASMGKILNPKIAPNGSSFGVRVVLAPDELAWHQRMNVCEWGNADLCCEGC